MKKLVSFSAISLLLVLASCTAPKGGFQTVDATQAAQIAAHKKVTILDVRTPREFSQGHLPKAINIDYLANTFDRNLDSLDKEKKYLVYCGSGRRSSEAVVLMKKKGFRNVTDMLGGIGAWKGEIEK